MFGICKSHEPHDFSECCGNCGQDVTEPHATMDRDGDWILLCEDCFTKHVNEQVKP